MPQKDFFSGQSKSYATFRPVYPESIYQFIYQHLNGRSAAWDCATGNGQVARELAKHFQGVWATDISARQLEHAYKADNIFYSVSPAEKTDFHDHQFDLITVAQALHWFDVDEFHNEVNRVAKENALLAVWGYGNCSIAGKEVQELFLHFYHDVVGPYWDDARRHVENGYRDIAFPFKTIQAPEFSIGVEWSMNDFLGYLSTWSATQKYKKETGIDPVGEYFPSFEKSWPAHEIKRVSFPLFFRLGKIKA
jgi:hypothetical protein